MKEDNEAIIRKRPFSQHLILCHNHHDNSSAQEHFPVGSFSHTVVQVINRFSSVMIIRASVHLTILINCIACTHAKQTKCVHDVQKGLEERVMAVKRGSHGF